MWGTKLRIARLVLTFLPAVGFILPWSNIKGTGSSFVLSILAVDGSKSLIDLSLIHISPLVTPTSQIVGTQSVFNVITGERYKMVTKEFKDMVCLLYTSRCV